MNERCLAQIAGLIVLGRLAVSIVNFTTLWAHQSANQTLFTSEAFRIGRELDDRKTVIIAYLFSEGFSLRNIARIAIQNESILAIVAFNALGHDSIHNGIA